MVDPVTIAISLAGLLHKGAKVVVPMQVEKRIQTEVNRFFQEAEERATAQIQRVTRIYLALTAFTLCNALLYSLGVLPNWLNRICILLVWLVPLVQTLGFIQNIRRIGPRILNLEHELTERIKQSIQEQRLDKKVAKAIYDSRSPKQYAEIAIGKSVFRGLDLIKKNQKAWGVLLGSYLLSYAALLIVRFGV